MKGWCCKCKKEKEMTKEVKTKTKLGRPMIKGICSSCGCKMCRITK